MRTSRTDVVCEGLIHPNKSDRCQQHRDNPFLFHFAHQFAEDGRQNENSATSCHIGIWLEKV